MRLCVGILNYKRENFLKHCLRSIALSAERCPYPLKLDIVVFGNGAPVAVNTKDFNFPLRTYWREAPLNLGAARNFLTSWFDFRGSKGMLFLDDDVLLPEHFFTTLVELLEKRTDVHFFSGPNVGPPDPQSKFESINSQLLADLLVTGPFSQRYRRQDVPQKGTSRNLTLSHLFVRPEVLSQVELSCSLNGGEDNDFFERLEALGFQGLHHPDIYVHHHRRTSLLSLFCQMFKYGAGRADYLSRGRWWGPPKTFLIGVIFSLSLILLLPLIIALYPLFLLLVALKTKNLKHFCGTVAQVTVLQTGYVLGLWIHLLKTPTIGYKQFFRISAAKFFPKFLAVPTYKIIFHMASFASRRIHPEAVHIYYRNSLFTGRIQFAKSDIDSTVIFKNNCTQKTHAMMELFGEVFYVEERLMPLLAKMANPHVLKRDPGLLKYQNLHSPTSAETLTFLIRKLEVNIDELSHELFLSKEKWLEYLSALQQDVKLKDLSSRHILSVIEKSPELQQMDTPWDSLRRLFSFQQMGLADFEIAELAPHIELLNLMPHRFCFLPIPESSTLPYPKLFQRQIDWELWGLLALSSSQAPHVAHIKKLQTLARAFFPPNPDWEFAFNELLSRAQSETA